MVDAVVVGAGFGGLYALHRLRSTGLSVVGFEAGDGPGGTWYWNRYPGARVDIESMIYSYSFDEELEQQWHWPEHFSPREDLERYANHVADRYHLRELIRFGTRVTGVRYDEVQRRWHVTTDAGDEVIATYVIAATGSLNAVNVPPFAGLDTFRGEWHHTSDWPAAGVDVRGRRVGVLGTGSTGIQIVPMLAPDAAHLTVFQRTPNFSLPSYNRPTDPDYERTYKSNYPELRRRIRDTESASVLMGKQYDSVYDVSDDEREQILEQAWTSRSGFRFIATFSDVRSDPAANELVAEFVRRKIRGIVRDPATAALLCPTDHPIGSKRICMDTGYYETFNRANVSLVDVRTNPITAITERGVATTAGEYPLDVLVFATGFDAVTGSLTRMNVTGVGGENLADHWSAGAANYLGLMVAGFPNFFMIHGPGSPSVLSQMIMSGEWQVDWITGVIEHLRAEGLTSIGTTPAAEAAWGAETAAVAERTLFLRADSWYVGANIEGKPRVMLLYVGGFDRYAARCEAAVARDYEGFVLS